jgi:hypothetical protein
VRADELGREAEYLHALFFRRELPGEVRVRYVAANEMCCPVPDPVTQRVVALRLDAEAVELALRIRKVRTELSTKIRILFYLLEVRSAYFGYFIGDGESWPRAWAGIAAAGLRSAAKYLKGEYLVRRYGLL